MIFGLIKLILGNLIKLIWLGKVNGLENIPKKGGCIICANHSSYLDFLILAAVCPRRIYFLAGEVFFRRWQWRWLVKLTKQIKVDRNSKDKSESIKKVEKYLEEGKVIGIFPEGTRSANGKIHEFYNGAVRIALKMKVPIVPVGIKGAYEIMSKSDKLPKFNKKCDLRFGELIDYSKYTKEFYNKSLISDLIRDLMNVIGDLLSKRDIDFRSIKEHSNYNALFFKKHLPVYFFVDFFTSPLHNEIVHRINKKDSKIIDIACGTGSQVIKLAKKGFSVVGLDLSEDMLRKAKSRTKLDYNLKFVFENAVKTKYDKDVFDVSIISLGLHDMSEEMAELVLKEMMRITKYNGQIFIIEHDESRSWLYYKIVNIWESKYFEGYIKKGIKYFLNKVKLIPIYQKSNIIKTLQLIECVNKK